MRLYCTLQLLAECSLGGTGDMPFGDTGLEPGLLAHGPQGERSEIPKGRSCCIPQLQPL